MKIESAGLSGPSNLPVISVPMFFIRIEAIVHHLAGNYIKVSFGVNPMRSFVGEAKRTGVWVAPLGAKDFAHDVSDDVGGDLV